MLFRSFLFLHNLLKVKRVIWTEEKQSSPLPKCTFGAPPSPRLPKQDIFISAENYDCTGRLPHHNSRLCNVILVELLHFDKLLVTPFSMQRKIVLRPFVKHWWFWHAMWVWLSMSCVRLEIQEWKKLVTRLENHDRNKQHSDWQIYCGNFSMITFMTFYIFSIADPFFACFIDFC